LDEKGKRHIERFNVSEEGQRLIKDFDAGKKIEPKGFTLLPPSRTQTAKAQRDYMRKFSATHKRPPESKHPRSKKRRPSHTRFETFQAAV